MVAFGPGRGARGDMRPGAGRAEGRCEREASKASKEGGGGADERAKGGRPRTLKLTDQWQSR